MKNIKGFGFALKEIALAVLVLVGALIMILLLLRGLGIEAFL